MSEETKKGRPAYITKDTLIKLLDDNFSTLTKELESKVAQAGQHVTGLAKWMEVQLKTIEKRILADNVGITAHDMALTSLIDLLERKNILAKDEFKEELNKKTNEKIEQINAKESKK